MLRRIAKKLHLNNQGSTPVQASPVLKETLNQLELSNDTPDPEEDTKKKETEPILTKKPDKSLAKAPKSLQKETEPISTKKPDKSPAKAPKSLPPKLPRPATSPKRRPRKSMSKVKRLEFNSPNQPKITDFFGLQGPK